MRNMTGIEDLRRELNRASYENFGYSVFAKSRKSEFVYQRQTVMYIIYDLHGYSLAQTGQICSNGHVFDHATALHSIKIVRNDLKLYERRRSNLRYWINIVNKILNVVKENDDVLQFLNKIEVAETMNDKDKTIISKIKKQLGYV